jgi:hypothetical protein
MTVNNIKLKSKGWCNGMLCLPLLKNPRFLEITQTYLQKIHAEFNGDFSKVFSFLQKVELYYH